MARKIYFTPGPSQLYFTVEEHLRNALREQIPSISHRSKAFKSIYQFTMERLKEVFQLPEGYQIFFTSSATEIWEHCVHNVVREESYHLVNGAFSGRFHQFSGQLGKRNTSIEAELGSCTPPDEIDLPSTAELLALTLNESSTGVAYPLDYISSLRNKYPEVLIAVDGVSSLPITQLDLNNVDSAYLSVQKCFGLPAGLGLWIVGPGMIEKSGEMERDGSLKVTYRSLIEMQKKGAQFQTIETPNVLNIYLLGKVVEDMLTKGMDMIRRESKYKAAVLSNLIDQQDWLEHFVSEPSYRSETIVVAKCTRDNLAMIDQLNDKGMVVGAGYGKYKAEHLRFANFPTHSKEQVEMLVDTLAAL